ncbi:uncharacterized protein F4812DRAFT_458136 [Daldinia caldariorum]|uniref:uncharacterized protein n=1 Tax=Daldinia caldariorum TaxID=326644 RepID=UPI002007FC4A|nr:uncharacterized protein F4812DRAFT_458136 [Daldinia caldariorum]KAI1468608.1 hypothetical protein F4812DRAFT_458136 [Daldinia caldariorum]
MPCKLQHHNRQNTSHLQLKYLPSPDPSSAPTSSRGRIDAVGKMSISILPNEVLQEILNLAVLARTTRSSIDRAVRLRLVSRLWNVTTIYAIYQSGILKIHETPLLPYICRPFLPRYLVDSSTRMNKPLTRPFLVVRKVAKHVLAFRGEDTSEENLKDFIGKISKVCMNGDTGYEIYKTWIRLPRGGIDTPTDIAEDDEDFMQALLAAAALTNEVQLVNELLPRFKNSTHLIAPRHPYCVRIIHLEREYYEGRGKEVCFFNAFALARSVEAFERLYELYRDYINDESFYSDAKLLSDEFYFDTDVQSNRTNSFTLVTVLLKLLCRYAAAGDVPLIEHMIQICNKRGLSVEDLNNTRKYKLRSPLGRAAKNGHLGTAVYLLKKGFKADSNSIQMAARHGHIPMCGYCWSIVFTIRLIGEMPYCTR